MSLGFKQFFLFFHFIFSFENIWMKHLTSAIIVSEYEIHPCYYVYFWPYRLGKGMNPLIPTSYWLNSTTTVLLQG